MNCQIGWKSCSQNYRIFHPKWQHLLPIAEETTMSKETKQTNVSLFWGSSSICCAWMQSYLDVVGSRCGVITTYFKWKVCYRTFLTMSNPESTLTTVKSRSATWMWMLKKRDQMRLLIVVRFTRMLSVQESPACDNSRGTLRRINPITFLNWRHWHCFKKSINDWKLLLFYIILVGVLILHNDRFTTGTGIQDKCFQVLANRLRLLRILQIWWKN